MASLKQEGEALSLAKQSGEEQNALLVQRARRRSSEHAQWRAEAEAREASLAEKYTAEQARGEP